MTKTNGYVLAAILMASTSTMAIGQTTTPDPTTGGATTTTPAPTTGAGTTGTGTTGTGTTGTGTTGTGTTGTGTTGTDTTGTGTTGTGTTGTGTTGTMPGTGTTGTDTAVGGTSESDEHRQLIASLSVSALRDQDWKAEFKDVSEDSEVEIVKLSELRESNETDKQMLDEAMSGLEDSRDDLRSAVEEHDKLTSALEEEDYAADDVVAAVVEPVTGDKVTLIVDDENKSGSSD
ncbi:MAG: hypothetical protein LPK02_09520 [Rhodobacterales bacterium]|nr:hypothetical protein [Rhodobacterales bacterium]MDX5413269.1 hypothetical protein [Rhodobacterales bacterium]